MFESKRYLRPCLHCWCKNNDDNEINYYSDIVTLNKIKKTKYTALEINVHPKISLNKKFLIVMLLKFKFSSNIQTKNSLSFFQPYIYM